MLHSKQWHYSLHRDFQNCYSTRRSLTGFFSSNSTRVPIHHPSTYNLHMHNYTTVYPENSPSRIQFYMQKTKSSSSTTTTYRGQRDLHSRIQKRNSTHRRQGDLLEMHPCVTRTFQTIQSFQSFQTFQSFQPFQTFQSFQTFRTFQSFMTFQPFQAILQVPVSPGIPTHSSILQLESIFYNSYSSIGFHRKLHQVPVEQLQTFLQTLHSSKKGRCCDIGCVEEVGDIANMPIGRNAIFVEDVEDKTLPGCQADQRCRIATRITWIEDNVLYLCMGLLELWIELIFL